MIRAGWMWTGSELLSKRSPGFLISSLLKYCNYMIEIKKTIRGFTVGTYFSHMRTMKRIGYTIVIFYVLSQVLLFCQDPPSTPPLLRVSENQRFLQDENGNPFFWMGDTGWLLFSKLSREEADDYLEDRAMKGFSVIQVMVLHNVKLKNFYSDSALVNRRCSSTPCYSRIIA